MVNRIFVEKKEGLRQEADTLLSRIHGLLGIDSVDSVRILNRYDVEGLDGETFEYAAGTILSEPQLDNLTENIEGDFDEIFAVEYLPGQFDQRASSAAECIQLMTKGERPVVRSAKVYLIKGNPGKSDIEKIKNYVINPVEAREASLEKPDTLEMKVELPGKVEILEGFNSLDEEGLKDFVKRYGLAMDTDDIAFCQAYFRKEGREPTVTEIRMIDTYWSDHCRHTTFLTTIDSIEFEDPFIEDAYREYLETRKKLGRTKPINLMDIGTLAAKCLKAEGKLQKLDESEEINACTVKMTLNHDGNDEDWLLLFKNETHNHPTEIEPFGGAATCIGGAIRDPLSGRSYVYGAMRVTGAADPLKPYEETMKGKLPQRTLVTTAANGYSSYGNQIGLATGQVSELYHPGYAAKRMEIGAVVAATPAENVRREVPLPGDVIVLLGGRTGRDGIGGATGSSKSHTLESLDTCGAEVQKGNAPEERKLQRLFRNPEASRLIKRCNDFGAGGVSVAVGELAEGLHIDLDKVPKKYEGLDGTELAISESQERMAVALDKKDVDRFIEICNSENLEATVVAEVTERPYLTMDWNGQRVCDVSREFLDSNGAEKHIDIKVRKQESFGRDTEGDFAGNMKALCSDLNVCSQRGLSERFDSTIGAGSVLMPFGGSRQRTPVQAMVNKVSVEHGDTDTCSFMAWGYNPFIMEKDQFHGAYISVIESLSKLIAAGATPEDTYLTFQEYFGDPRKDPERWGRPAAALLGAFKAQLDMGTGAIGGKDSMSGSFEDLDVPPTLVSFAVTTDPLYRVRNNCFAGAGHRIVLISPEYDKYGVPKPESLKKVFEEVSLLNEQGAVYSMYTPGYGGIAESLFKMGIGNRIGIKLNDILSEYDLFGYRYGSFVIEVRDLSILPEDALIIGETTRDYVIERGGETVSMDTLEEIYEGKLESVFTCNMDTEKEEVPEFRYETYKVFKSPVKAAVPKALIPVFPGTNCEYDTVKAFERAGAEVEVYVINNLDSSSIERSVNEFAEKIDESHILFIPGGFSGGDEPDGSGKFITSFFRNPEITEKVTELLEERGGLMGGICNGFQALIKLGLVPYGKIIDTDENCPTLTYNTIGRHQSKIVRTKLCTNNSPWLRFAEPGSVYSVPISHGEGRLVADPEMIMALAERGQILTQYVDEKGVPSMDIDVNPNGSVMAVEGLLSPDGHVFGKMGHSERIGTGLYRNVPGEYDMKLFESAVSYFRKA